MDAALASLLGAVIGGSVVAASNFGLEAVRSKRERIQSNARDHEEARRAARLLTEELEVGRRLLARDLDAGTHSWEPPERQLPAAAWTEYRTDFARVAPPDAWHAVAAAYARFDEVNWHVAAVIEEDHWTGAEPQHPMERRDLGPRSRELFTNAVIAVDLGLALLADLMTVDAD